ncbi:MAG: TauD/TfdA family dioxygenase [Hyphomicrobiaceae bacterium]|nr:TauD/TfdA family dioxygenase [Hyphomicrobiaceae bacterium]
MPMQIRQLGPGFAGEVSGLDLTRPLPAEDIAAVHAAMDRYAVLVFHGQSFTNEQQLAFTESLGPIEHDFASSLRKPDRLPSTFADVSNLDKDGRTLARTDMKRLYNLGNQLWHSDSSFKTVPAKYSLLHCRSVTSKGGNTEFADMRQAWDALDQETKDLCEPLICEHSRFHSRARLGFTAGDYTDADAATIRPVLQRLVRLHPGSRRKSVYLSAHAGKIVGWPEPEAKAFLMDLTEHATQREFTYAHKWQVGDLVMWDNRCTMHRARPYPHDEARDMRRTTLAGDGPTVASQGAWGTAAE